nr:hypothetical protein [Paenibacillus dendritiformis]
MNTSNDNTARPEVQDEIIELGVASSDTWGGPYNIEGVGGEELPGISAE